MEPYRRPETDQVAKNRKALVVDTSGISTAGPASSGGSSARFTPSPYDVRYFPRNERPRTPVRYEDVASQSTNDTAPDPDAGRGFTHRAVMDAFAPANRAGWLGVPFSSRGFPHQDQQPADSAYGSLESPVSLPYGQVSNSHHHRGLSMASLATVKEDYSRGGESLQFSAQKQESPFSAPVFTNMEPQERAVARPSPFAASLWHQRSASVPRVGPSSLSTALRSATQSSWAAEDPFWSPRTGRVGAPSAPLMNRENGRDGQSCTEDPGQQSAFNMQDLRVALPALTGNDHTQRCNDRTHNLSHNHGDRGPASLALGWLGDPSSLVKVGHSAAGTQPIDVSPASSAFPARGMRSLAVPGFTPMRACLAAAEEERAQGQQVARPALSSQACCSSKFSVRYKGMHTTKNASNDILPDRLNCSVWITNLPEDITYAELLESVGSRGRIFCSFINSPDGIKFHTAAAKVVFFKPGPAQRLRDEAAHPGFYVRGHRTRITLNRIKSGEVQVAGRNCRVLIITGRDDFVNEQTLREWFDRRIVWQGDGVNELIHARGRRVLEWRFGSYRNQAEMAKLALEKDRPVGLEHVEFGFDPNEVGAEDMSSYAIAAERIQGRY